MLIAAYAVNEMLARLMSYRVGPNSEFAQRRISLSDTLASSSAGDGEVCESFAKRIDFGDIEPLLGVVDLCSMFDLSCSIE
jgi:hypothetical protein